MERSSVNELFYNGESLGGEGLTHFVHAVAEADYAAEMPVLKHALFQGGHGVGFPAGPDVAEADRLVDFAVLQACTELFCVGLGEARDVRPGILNGGFPNDEPEDSSLFTVKGENSQAVEETGNLFADFETRYSGGNTVNTGEIDSHGYKTETEC